MWPNGASNSKHAHRAARTNMEQGMNATTRTHTNVAPPGDKAQNPIATWQPLAPPRELREQWD